MKVKTEQRTLLFILIALMGFSSNRYNYNNRALFGGEIPPFVTMVTPNNNASNVSPSTDIILVFSEPVNIPFVAVDDNSININCSISGTQTFPSVDTNGVMSITIELTDFTSGETCTIVASSFHIHDASGFNHLDGNGDGEVGDDFESTFIVGSGSDLIYADGFEM